MGLTTMPLSKRFTWRTAAACASTSMLRWSTPIPPSCAIAIAMSASVTVSMAEDRTGILSGISRVNWVRVSAWLGSTLDSRGCSSTSSNVSPSGMSGASFRWAISAHAKEMICQGLRLVRPLQKPLRRFNVHALDHLVVEPLGAAVESLDELAGALELGVARGKGAVARRDLVRVDQALAIEPEAAPVLGLREEALGVVKAIEDPSNAAIRPSAPQARSSAARRRSAPASNRAATGGRRASRWFR